MPVYEVAEQTVVEFSSGPEPVSRLLVPTRIALIGGFSPRRCGIATFTSDIYDSLKAAAPHMAIDVYAMSPALDHTDFGSAIQGVIVEQDRESYTAAAQKIAASNADVVWLQHEFGLFGGPAGDMILDLIDAIAAPLFITMHTMIPDPDPDQMRVVKRLVARASKLMVMSERGRFLLETVYGASADQIEVIPHGVPDRPFGRTVQFKAKLGFGTSRVLMTFGLLSPGKGIEAVISALPAIVADHPETIYCIVGATHPNLLAHEGEAYRYRLQSLARTLGVAAHIRWIDAFLDTDELLDLIEAADIYVTPYLGAAQATSGTLSYAVALGKAVVSTPYVHASELLADNHGVLVPFGNSQAISEEIGALLDNPDRLLTIQKNAYRRGRAMVWPAFAKRSLSVIDQIRVSPKRTLFPVNIGITGLLRICDDTGILQHSVHSIPDRAHGYCVDDNARALMLMNRLGADAEPHRSRLATIFAAFVQNAWNHDAGAFRNFMGFGRNWLESVGSEDSCGRTLWALGTTAREGQTPAIRRWARGLFDQAASSATEFGSPRAIGFAMLGADRLLDVDPHHDFAMRLIEHGAETLLTLFDQVNRDGWIWFEAVLAYDNARLPEAMIRAGKRLSRADVTGCGLRSLHWINEMQIAPAGHFRPIGSDSFGHDYKLPRPFDQQPVEIWAAIDACSAAFDATGDPTWLAYATRAYDWFAGANDRGVVVGDPVSGSCHDGINPRGLNLNEGAESVLAYQLSTSAIMAFKTKAGKTKAGTTKSGAMG